MPPRQPPEPSLVDVVKEWYDRLPPVTKAIITLTGALSIAPTFGLIHPSTFILEFSQVTKKLQLWRLVSCFFVNQLNIGSAITAYYTYQYSLELENDAFRGQTADYVFYHIITAAMQLVVARYFNLIILSEGLSASIMTIWSRRYRDRTISFWGGFQFKARYMPLVVTVFHMLSTGSWSLASMAGIGSAYAYDYLTDTYPNQGGPRLLNTPQFLHRIFPPRTPVQGTFGAFGAQRPRPQPATNVFGGHSWGRGQRLGS